jgi:hypothetical protein
LIQCRFLQHLDLSSHTWMEKPAAWGFRYPLKKHRKRAGAAASRRHSRF